MEPDDLADAMMAILDASLAAGMDADVKSFAFEVSADGDVAVKSTSGAGKAFDLAIPAADMAEALDGEIDAPAPKDDAPPAKDDAAEVAA